MNSYKYIFLFLLVVGASNFELLIAQGQKSFRGSTSTSFLSQLKKSISRATNKHYIAPFISLGRYIFAVASIYGPFTTLSGYACYNYDPSKPKTPHSFKSKYKLHQNNIY